MPIIKAAIKDLRKSQKRRKVNRIIKSDLKEELKIMKRLALAKKFDEFKTRLPKTFSIIDKAAKRHMLHKNNAAHKKSFLAGLVPAK